MNLDRHIEAHKQLFQNLVKGDGDSAHKHREFYDEYLAVMDLPADYYLQTVDTVFCVICCRKGAMTHRGRPIDSMPSRASPCSRSKASTTTSPVSGRRKPRNIFAPAFPPTARRIGCSPASAITACSTASRFRSEIAPRISDFVLTMGQSARTCAQRLRQARAVERRARARAAIAQPSRPHSVALTANAGGRVNALRLLRFRRRRRRFSMPFALTL